MNRRDFLKISGKLAAIMGLSKAFVPQIAVALDEIATGQKPVLWLQGQSCSGCSVSFLNSESPDPAQILTQYISLKFHSVLSTATGKVAQDAVNETINEGNYFLVVEGSVPEGMPQACLFGGEYFGDQLQRAAQNCIAVVSAGTCAAFGGIPAAEGNSTGSTSVQSYLQAQNIRTTLINIPGCPTHPDWVVSTLAYTIAFGIPDLNNKDAPKMFFDKLVHDMCPRFAEYERQNFANSFGEPGCLFHLGCQGPITRADCTLRKWNGGNTHCINSGGPCIGCSSEHFSLKRDFPFYTKDTKDWTI